MPPRPAPTRLLGLPPWHRELPARALLTDRHPRFGLAELPALAEHLGPAAALEIAFCPEGLHPCVLRHATARAEHWLAFAPPAFAKLWHRVPAALAALAPLAAPDTVTLYMALTEARLRATAPDERVVILHARNTRLLRAELGP